MTNGSSTAADATRLATRHTAFWAQPKRALRSKHWRLRIAIVGTVAMLFSAIAYSPGASAMSGPHEVTTVITTGGTDDEYTQAIAIDSNGNSYITGRFEGTADFDGDITTTADQVTSNGATDVFVASYDAAGGYRWSARSGGAGSDDSFSIAVDGSGNTYITGWFFDTGDFDGDITTTADQQVSEGSADIFINSYDPAGAYRWSTTTGGSNFDQSKAIALDPAGNIYISGDFNDTGDFDGDIATTADQRVSEGSSDAFIASYDSAGAYRWVSTFGRFFSETSDSLAVDSSGNSYVTGRFSSLGDFDGDITTTADQRFSAGSSDVFVASYDPSGVYRWATTAGGVGFDNSDSIAIDPSGNSYITGAFTGTGDFDGDPATTADQVTLSGGSDIFIASYDNTGTYRWVSAASAGGGGSDAIAIDAAGNSYITGGFFNGIDLDGDLTTTADQRTSNGSVDLFIASYDPSGAYLWSTSAGGSDFDGANAIAVAGNGTAYVAGFFEDTVDFDGDPSTTADERTSNGDRDVYVLQLAVVDTDGDGFDGPGGDGSDCDDGDATINPSASDVAYNGIDEDCSGQDLDDVDGDGSPSTAATGGTPDCDDGDATINPGATEMAYDGIDQDCDGVDLDDVDGDGSPSTAATGGTPDCDDGDATINPAATDLAGDGIDQDCDGVDAPVVSTALCNGLVVTIDMNTGASGFGTAVDDVILGTPGADVIDGMGGDDTICGEDGDDNISGSAGVDFIFGGDGDDTMTGGDGNDRIRGQKGIDDISGGPGNDFLYGGVEGDTIDGGDGNDTIGGFGGADMIDGGPGNDRIFGGFGADTINGGDGDDKVLGLVGNDIINGEAGDDELNGDNGQDTINGGPGNDVIKGGNSLDLLIGGDGDDNVAGGRSDDTLSGGPGNDTCTGNTETIADTADTTCETIFGVP